MFVSFVFLRGSSTDFEIAFNSVQFGGLFHPGFVRNLALSTMYNVEGLVARI